MATNLPVGVLPKFTITLIRRNHTAAILDGGSSLESNNLSSIGNRNGARSAPLGAIFYAYGTDFLGLSQRFDRTQFGRLLEPQTEVAL